MAGDEREREEFELLAHVAWHADICEAVATAGVKVSHFRDRVRGGTFDWIASSCQGSSFSAGNLDGPGDSATAANQNDASSAAQTISAARISVSR